MLLILIFYWNHYHAHYRYFLPCVSAKHGSCTSESQFVTQFVIRFFTYDSSGCASVDFHFMWSTSNAFTLLTSCRWYIVAVD